MANVTAQDVEAVLTEKWKPVLEKMEEISPEKKFLLAEVMDYIHSLIKDKEPDDIHHFSHVILPKLRKLAK